MSDAAPPPNRTFRERVRPSNASGGFVDRLHAGNPTDIYLVRGKDSTDRPAWYYVRVHRGKQRAFEAKAGTDNLSLTEYGDILLSGYGMDPPSDVVKRMRDDYGFDGG